MLNSESESAISSQDLPVAKTEAAESLNFALELWSRLRPYLLVIATDSFIALALYLVLFVFHLLATALPIMGWEGQWIPHIHGIGIIGAFVLFAYFIVPDLYRVHKNNKVQKK